MNTFLQDLRYGLRMLAKTPGVTAAAALSLALGIGANSTIFSFADGCWLRPLPVKDPGSLVRVFTSTPRFPDEDLSYPDYQDVRSASKTLSDLIAVQRRGPWLTIDATKESTHSHIVSDNYFSALGVSAAVGRVFTESPGGARQEAVLVVSHNFWQRRLGGDPQAVGKMVMLNDWSFTIIGVAPRGFRGTELWTDPDLWIPMSAWDPISPGELVQRNSRDYSVVGRLRPGASVDQARAEVAAIARNLAEAYHSTNKGCGGVVMSEREYELGRAGTTGLMLAGVAVLVLLIACANVTNLLLVRGESRRREIAIRQSLGSSRARLVRQLLTESVLLAAIGAALAVLLAAWLIETVPALLGARDYEFRLDPRVLGFTLVTAVLTALLFGLAPALAASKTELVSSLKGEALARPGRRWLTLRNALVVGQVALSLVLLDASGLLIRSLIHAQRVDLGYERKNVLFVQVAPELPAEPARVFFDQLVERVRTLPGVKQASLARRAPLWPSEGGVSEPVVIPGYQSPSGEQRFQIKFNTVAPDFFRTLGIRLLRGRDFTERDDRAAPRVVIISETMARQFWPKQDPIGRLIRTGGTKPVDWEVVGVVRDAKMNYVLEPPEPYFYIPFGQGRPWWAMTLTLETAGDPLALAGAVKGEISALAKSIPAPTIDTLQGLMRRSLRSRQMQASLVSGLGLLGLLLASIGLYGVTSYAVSRRTHEIGIRMALGAQRIGALRLILRQGLVLALAGIVIGLPASLAATRRIEEMLYGVRPTDPVTYTAVCVGIIAVAQLASLLPARRATRVDPAVALKYE